MFLMTSLTKWQGDKMTGHHLNIQFVLKVKKTLTFGNDVLIFSFHGCNQCLYRH